MTTITNPKEIAPKYNYVVIFAPTEAQARAEFDKRYPWAAIAPLYRLRNDWYFPVEFERKMQVTG